MDERKEKCALNKLTVKQELYEYLKAMRSEFNTFREMCKYVDDSLLARLRASEDISFCRILVHLRRTSVKLV